MKLGENDQLMNRENFQNIGWIRKKESKSDNMTRFQKLLHSGRKNGTVKPKGK